MSIDPQAAASAAMSAMREAAIALIVANTAIMRRTTPEEVEDVFFPMAEEFCSSDIIVFRRSNNTKKDIVNEFHFSACPTADIATMVKFMAGLSEIYVEDKMAYDYNNTIYEGFCYHNSAGEFCALLHNC